MAEGKGRRRNLDGTIKRKEERGIGQAIKN